MSSRHCGCITNPVDSLTFQHVGGPLLCGLSKDEDTDGPVEVNYMSDSMLSE